MDNKVKNAIYAYHIDNSDGYGSYVELSGIKLPAEEFAFDIWYKSVGLCSSMVSQKNGFSVGISFDGVIVRLASGKSLSIKNNVTKIPDGVWTNLYLSYDKKEIIVYINGYKFGSAACTGKVKNSENFQVGTEFTGFIRSIRLYSKIVSEESFKNYFMSDKFDSKTMLNVAAFMDFTKENIPDLSGKGVKTAVHESCALVDTVEVYCLSKGSFAHFADSSPFNIGGFESGEFSLYSKIYIRPAEQKRHIIAINGTVGNSQSIGVFADCRDDTISFTVAAVGEEHTFKSDIKTYSWVDLIVCAKSTQLTVYINGTKQNATLSKEYRRTDKGDFKLGGCIGCGDMTCQHYIHTVAVFNKVLSDKDAKDFLENHPFVFEDHLTALVDFSAGSADELVNGTEVYINNDDLITAVNTVDTLPDQAYQYRINYSAAVSEMKKWEAETVVEGVRSFAGNGFGLACTAGAAETTVLTVFLGKSPKILEDAAELYAENVITSKGYAKALGSMSKSASKVCMGALKPSCGGTATGTAGAVVGTSAVFSKMQELVFPVIAGAGALAVVAGIGAKAVSNSRRQKPYKEDEDSKVILSSISLQISPDDYAISAVRCRNYEGVISGTQWTGGENCKSPAVYIADKLKRARIRVKYKLAGILDAKTTHTVSLNASVCRGTNKIFDNFKYESSGISVGKEYEAELESGITCSMQKEIAHENIELWWSARVDGKEVVLPNTKLDVYVVPTVPCQPISLEKDFPNNYISVDYLGVLSECKASRSNESNCKGDRLGKTWTIEEIYQLANDIYFHPRFYYQPNQEKYVRWKEYRGTEGRVIFTAIIFDEKNFFKDLYAKMDKIIGVQCDVYATFLYYSLNLIGVRCRYAYIINPLFDVQGNRAALKVHGAYPAGSRIATDYSFRYHMIIEVAPQPKITGIDGIMVFDASMGAKDKNNEVNSLGMVPFYGSNSMYVSKWVEPFSYRGLAIQDGTAAIIDTSAFVFLKEGEQVYDSLLQ